MFLSRAPSRLIRLRRSSPGSQKQNHHDKACIYCLLSVFLVFSTLAFFQAKLGNHPAVANYHPHLGLRSIYEFNEIASNAPYEVAAKDRASNDINGHSSIAVSVNEADTLHSVFSEHRNLEANTKNASSLLATDDANEDDDGGDENADIEGELELDDDVDSNLVDEILEEGEEEKEDKLDVDDELDGGIDEGDADKQEEEEEEEDRKDEEVSDTVAFVNRTNELVNRSSKEENNDEIEKEARVDKFLQRTDPIQTLPRWDPLEDMGGRNKSNYISTNRKSRQSMPTISQTQSSGIIWDHVLDVARRTSNFSSLAYQSRLKRGSGDNGLLNGHIGNKRVEASDSRQMFSSDDEPLDQNIRDKLEEVVEIEDALLLHTRKRIWAEKKPNKADSSRRERTPIDPLNPANNPLLQDPDTTGPSGLTGSDKAILRDLRRASIQRSVKEIVQTEKNPAIASSAEKLDTIGTFQGTNNMLTVENGERITVQAGNAADRSILEISISASLQSSSSGKDRFFAKDRVPSSHSTSRRIYKSPGEPDSALTFSEFLYQFLDSSRCSINIFMAWTTPPWSYTIRYQRALESILYFHPDSCVVVFSETIGLDLFASFLADGFKIAVLQPHLEELLEGTPADVFSSILPAWRKTRLFHIHFTELLRLAALYKYGGVYLDMDVILLKPLDVLHNAIGLERMQNGSERLNGAVMVFDRSSPFLLDCMTEFAATYDDELSESNGADLLTRVADGRRAGNENTTQRTRELHIEPPDTFFPISSENITRYLTAPVTQEQQVETDETFLRILNHSMAFHFWNQKTQRQVPEIGSLVERVINHHCLRCQEYL